MLTEWFHHLFNPHCPECAHEKECKSCETYREQIAALRYENKHLLEALLPKKETTTITPLEDLEPVKPRHVPWAVKQQLLEREDRQKAIILKRQADERKDIEQLEKSLSLEIPEDKSNAS